MMKEDKIHEISGMGDLSDESQHMQMGEIGAEEQSEEFLQNSDNVLVLKHPIKVAGTEVKRLEYDFEALTAKDLHQASKYLKNLGIPVSIPALDYDYQMTVFNRAVRLKMPDVEFADIMRLSAADASKAAGLVRDFLLDKDPGLKDLGSEE